MLLVIIDGMVATDRVKLEVKFPTITSINGRGTSGWTNDVNRVSNMCL